MRTEKSWRGPPLKIVTTSKALVGEVHLCSEIPTIHFNGNPEEEPGRYERGSWPYY